MKKTTPLTRLALGALFALLVLAGCKKETSDTLSPEEETEAAQTASESQGEAEMASNDVFDNVIGVNAEVGIGGTGVFGRVMAGSDGIERIMNVDSTQCVNVTVTRLNPPQLFPVRITIDFGNGCTGPDGRIRSGKIITVYTGRLINAGATALTTFDNYKINGIAVSGEHKITNTTGSTQGSNQQQFTIAVRDGKLLRPNGDYIEWRSDRVLTQVEGNGTVMPGDDVFRLTGNSLGRTKKGNVIVAWNAVITEPLIKRFNCRWISKGIIVTHRQNLTTSSQWAASLNFGGGACDRNATLTVNGTVYPIQLPL